MACTQNLDLRCAKQGFEMCFDIGQSMLRSQNIEVYARLLCFLQGALAAVYADVGVASPPGEYDITLVDKQCGDKYVTWMKCGSRVHARYAPIIIYYIRHLLQTCIRSRIHARCGLSYRPGRAHARCGLGHVLQTYKHSRVYAR